MKKFIPLSIEKSKLSYTVGASAAILFGAFALPMSAFAVSQTATTSVNSTIAQSISVTSGGTVSVNVTPTGAGAQSYSSDTVNVSTNDSAGYTLTIKETTPAATTLTDGTNSIAATANTAASPAVQAVNTWGFCVKNAVVTNSTCPASATSSTAISGTNTVSAVPPSTPFTINTHASTVTNDPTTVWYAVAANTAAVASAAYTNSVTYTATGN